MDFKKQPNYFDGLAAKNAHAAGTITTTGTLTVLAAPGAGLYYRIKAISFFGVVTTVLAGTGVRLDLEDTAGTDIFTLSSMAANQAAGTVLGPSNSRGVIVLPGKGIKSPVANLGIRIAPDATLSTGVTNVAIDIFYSVVDAQG
jgi:hypothetical protein